MAGTKIGGQKAAAKNLAKDPNFYAKIGAKGGRNSRTGGFAANPDLARIAGAKGGRVSKRTGVKNKTGGGSSRESIVLKPTKRGFIGNFIGHFVGR